MPYTYIRCHLYDFLDPLISQETYTVYFTNSAIKPTVPYSPAGSRFAANVSNVLTEGGAGLVDNHGKTNIRSGNPGETNSASVLALFQDATHRITGVAFQYQYVSGYGPSGRQVVLFLL